jgi:hypothetical protein
MGEMKNACKILVGKPEEEKQIGISRYRWEYDIEGYLKGEW